MLGVAAVKPVVIAASLLAAVAVGRVGAASAGLLAIATDGERTVTFVTPTPNFALAEKQSIHPQLRPEFRVEWNGFLKIPRAGEYTINGTPEIFVNGTEASGVPMKLAAGEASLRVRFKRKEAGARMQLRWQSEFFPIEPIPVSAYSHETSPAASLVEEGRELVENLGCASCHKTEAGFVKARRGPVLSGAGNRLKPEWIYKWLADPRTLRRDATMPVLLHTDEERADVTAYLITAGRNQQCLVVDNARWRRGETVFKDTGCVACHTDTAVPLFGVGSKYRDAMRLAAYLLKPLEVSPHGRMPDMLLKRDEANYLAEWLMESGGELSKHRFG